MQERILKPRWRTKPDGCGYAHRRDGRFEFVYFPGESSGAEPPETESWVGLSVISNRVTGVEDHTGQFRIFGSLGTNQKKRRSRVVFFQEDKNVRRGTRVGAVVDG